MKQTFWKIELVIPRAAAHVFEGALKRFSLATSSFEIKGSDCWQLVSYSANIPDRTSLGAAIAIASAAAGVKEPNIICEPLPEVDWLDENRESFKPKRPPESCDNAFLWDPWHSGIIHSEAWSLSTPPA